MRFLVLLILMPITLSLALPAAETIHTDQLTVTGDQDGYTLQAAGQATPFVAGHWPAIPSSLSVVKLTDQDYGAGQGIRAVFPSGNSLTVHIHPSMPFALISATVGNSGTQATVLNKVPVAELDLRLDTPVDKLKTLGTGGLSNLIDKVGSYAWLTVVDPVTRHGVVGGWLTHEHGSGVIIPTIEDNKAHLDGRVEYGHLRIEPGATVESETFLIGWFADTRLGMERWADAVAKRLAITLPRMPVVYCTWYDNEHGGSGNEKDLAQLSAFAAKNLSAYGFTTVQIDDGWQMGDPQGNGPRKNFSAFDPNGPYRSGMKATADSIRADKLTAGLWLLPFGGNWNDPFFANHQDWFVKRHADGKPFDTSWGGTSLDMTDPGARAFVTGEVTQITHDWGYGYLKIDGLYTGAGVKQQYVNDQWREDDMGDAVFHDPSKTNIEVFRSGLRMLREAAGRATFILGCCAPQNMRSYAGVFGLVDAMRMGPDNSGTWQGWYGSSPSFGSRNYHLNGRIWWSDPDPTYVRATIPLDQARCMASWNAISGQMISLSDWLPTLPPERLDIIRRIIPGHAVSARPIDLFTTWPPRQWLVSDTRPDHPHRDVIALFNWSDTDENVSLPLASSGLPDAKQWIAFDFWNNSFVRPFSGTLALPVPSTSCRILAMHPLLAHPFLLSTSRHVTQGVIDVKKETWNESAGTLDGVSSVIAGDPYQMRAVALGDASNWNLSSASVSAEDAAAGVAISTISSNGLIRATITATQGREVSWSLHFTKSKPTVTAPAAIRNATWSLSDSHDYVQISWKNADGCDCEVAAAGQPALISTTGGYRLTSVASGKEYSFTLTSIDWNGRRGPPSVLVVKLPTFAQIGPVPAKPSVSITSLSPVESHTGYGTINKDHSVDGNPLRVGGATYADGMGVHADALLAYEVKPEYRRFVAVAGIDEEVKDTVGTMIFKVVAVVAGTPTELAASPTLNAAHAPAKWHFDVALPAQCTQLRLLVLPAGSDNRCDHGDWVDAGFITKP